MYPNQPQQNLGFYVPPPMVFSNQPANNPNFSMLNSNNNMSDMLGDLMRSKPNFSADVFGGQVYQSKFLWLIISSNYHYTLVFISVVFSVLLKSRNWNRKLIKSTFWTSSHSFREEIPSFSTSTDSNPPFDLVFLWSSHDPFAQS